MSDVTFIHFGRHFLCRHLRANSTGCSDLRSRRDRRQRGADRAGHVDGPAGSRSADRHVGPHRFGAAGPQDLDPGRGDAGRGNPHRSRRHVAGGRDPAGVAVQGDGPLDDRHVPAVVHVRSHPPTRRRVQPERWLGRGRPAPVPATGRWSSIWTPRSVRSTANRNRPPATATPASSAITRCSRPGPGPAKSCSPGCGKAPRTPPAGSSASLTNSPPTWPAPERPGR